MTSKSRSKSRSKSHSKSRKLRFELLKQNPNSTYTALCKSTSYFPRELLAEFARSRNVTLPKGAGKNEICTILSKELSKEWIYNWSVNLTDKAQTFLNRKFAGLSTHRYTQYILNELRTDLSNLVLQYSFSEVKPKWDDLQVLMMDADLSPGLVALQVQQYQAKYHCILSAINMVVYDVGWTVGKLIFGNQTPYFVRSTFTEKELALVTELRDEIQILLDRLQLIIKLFNNNRDTINKHFFK